MRSFSSCLLLLASLFSLGAVAEKEIPSYYSDGAVEFREKWSISRPTSDVEFQDDGSFVATLTYEVSAAIKDLAQFEVQAVSGKDCQFDDVSSKTMLVKDKAIKAGLVSEGDDKPHNEVTVKIAGSEREFCTRFGLFSMETLMIVNWLDAQVTVLGGPGDGKQQDKIETTIKIAVGQREG